PIIFAIIPLVENVPNARLIFNIVFFCTLVSLLVQGASFSIVAIWLGLAEEPRNGNGNQSVVGSLAHELKAVAAEIQITKASIIQGNRLMDLPLPEKTLVVMVKREGNYFIPTGATVLQEQDKLLIITDDNQELMETYSNLKIKEAN